MATSSPARFEVGRQIVGVERDHVLERGRLALALAGGGHALGQHAPGVGVVGAQHRHLLVRSDGTGVIAELAVGGPEPKPGVGAQLGIAGARGRAREIVDRLGEPLVLERRLAGSVQGGCVDAWGRSRGGRRPSRLRLAPAAAGDEQGNERAALHEVGRAHGSAARRVGAVPSELIRAPRRQRHAEARRWLIPGRAPAARRRLRRAGGRARGAAWCGSAGSARRARRPRAPGSCDR